MKFGIKAGLIAVAFLAIAGARSAQAQTFNGGIPAGWTCIGTCGALGANGDVPLAPSGGTQYGYVVSSTASGYDCGLPGIGTDPSGGCTGTGSILNSTVFSATVGQALDFSFDFITSDGSSTYPDYVWAELFNTADPLNPIVLFTARTNPGGNASPGFGLPANNAILTPGTNPIVNNSGSDAGTTWDPLAESSGQCFDGIGNGCGHTGWIQSTFNITGNGNYYLQFGATNFVDDLFQTGLAFDGLTIGGQVIGPPTDTVPEPTTMSLVAMGLVGLSGMRRIRRRSA